jgi:hypothetical protein
MFNKGGNIMETIVKRIAFIFLTLFMVFAFGQSAMALVGSEPGTNGSGGIVVNPNAPGTKYEGPLTIYYVPDPDHTGFSFMHIFLRLRKGSTLWGFSGISAVSVDPTVTTDGQAQVTAFMNNTVMPILYPSYVPPTDPNNVQTSNYPWYLKSVDQVVSDNALLGPPPCCNDMTFVIMDVIVAVQD